MELCRPMIMDQFSKRKLAISHCLRVPKRHEERRLRLVRQCVPNSDSEGVLNSRSTFGVQQIAKDDYLTAQLLATL